MLKNNIMLADLVRTDHRSHTAFKPFIHAPSFGVFWIAFYKVFFTFIQFLKKRHL